jgi:hypothetical protein
MLPKGLISEYFE